MARFFLFNQQGKLISIVHPMYEGMYTHLQETGGVTPYLIPEDNTLGDSELFEKAILYNNEVIIRPVQPTKWHIWNYVTAEWELPETYLDDLKNEVYINLRDATNSKILSIYPETTQRNKQARWSELFQIQVSSPTEFTEDLSSEKQSIEAIWNWIKNIRSHYAEATDAISLAEEENTILTLSEEYKTWLSALV